MREPFFSKYDTKEKLFSTNNPVCGTIIFIHKILTNFSAAVFSTNRLP